MNRAFPNSVANVMFFLIFTINLTFEFYYENNYFLFNQYIEQNFLKKSRAF